MTWKIVLPSGAEWTSANVTAGQFNSVAEVLENATWDTIEPIAGPRQLIAWVAILRASEDNDKDIITHLVDVMALPMAQLIEMLKVD